MEYRKYIKKTREGKKILTVILFNAFVFELGIVYNVSDEAIKINDLINFLTFSREL